MTRKLTVKALLKDHKINRAELAKWAGVDVSTVCRWENHGIPERGPARALLERIAMDSQAKGATA